MFLCTLFVVAIVVIYLYTILSFSMTTLMTVSITIMYICSAFALSMILLHLAMSSIGPNQRNAVTGRLMVAAAAVNILALPLTPLWLVEVDALRTLDALQQQENLHSLRILLVIYRALTSVAVAMYLYYRALVIHYPGSAVGCPMAEAKRFAPIKWRRVPIRERSASTRRILQWRRVTLRMISDLTIKSTDPNVTRYVRSRRTRQWRKQKAAERAAEESTEEAAERRIKRELGALFGRREREKLRNRAKKRATFARHCIKGHRHLCKIYGGPHKAGRALRKYRYAARRRHARIARRYRRFIEKVERDLLQGFLIVLGLLVLLSVLPFYVC